MNAHRMDQETVERLLAGSVGDPIGGSVGGPRRDQEPLVRLLAAVRAAPSPDELRGEGAALHAFRLARAGSAGPVRARPTLLAGLLSAKAALAALAVAATGGVALAATHGALPQPFDGAGERAEAPASGRPAPSRSPGRTAGSPGGLRDPRVPPAPLVVLCHRLRAEAAADEALAAPRYADLVAAAGGPDRVVSWCAEAVAASAPAAATPAPPPTPDPTGGAGGDGPGGRPGRSPATPTLPAGPPSGGPASPGRPTVPPTPPMPGPPSAPAGRPAPADRSMPATPAGGRPTTTPTSRPVPATRGAG
ncbi:hypothetical protein [Micromonospora sp. WMMD712]|uniref:hypothetical protein n=1 Tax=Micromonospora sp. WMMD712 TaxID=3016096 RepID=UPI002499DDDA|nr:hypothetical protein [Micromonospora sp. WMMD712]WFE60952.1 hypothetical protein O7633_30770 [Micromonospora sp. WMMD712]